MAVSKQRFETTDRKSDSFLPIKTDLIDRLTQEAKTLSMRPEKYRMKIRQKNAIA